MAKLRAPGGSGPRLHRETELESLGLTTKPPMKAKRAKTAGAVEVYAFADRVEITAHGDLILWRNAKDDRPAEQNLAFASGVWEFVYAASVMDGSAVAVQSWPGQITN